MDDLRSVSYIRFEPNDYPLAPGLRLLEASAGTGKTFALAHLALRLVTEREINIQKILVVTFTEAAAAELKFRVCNRLEQALEGLEAFEKGIAYISPDEVLNQWLLIHQSSSSKRRQFIQNLLLALESLDFLDITTIHGFCRRTLRRDALHAFDAIDPVIETDGQQIIGEVVNDFWHQQMLCLDSNDLRGLQDAGLNVETLSRTLLKLDNDPSLTLRVDDSNLDVSKPLHEQFKNFLNNCWDEFLECWLLEGKDLEEDFRSKSLEWRALNCPDTKPYSPKPRKNRFQVVDDWVNAFFAKKVSLEPLNEISYGFVWDQSLLRKYFHPAIFCEAARRCGEEHPDLLRPRLQRAISGLVDAPVEKVWVHSMCWCLKTLEQRRRRRGVLSYGGLLKAVDKGLNCSFPEASDLDRQEWLKTIRERYKVALIDEFQDTDPIQWRILRTLFANTSKHLLLMVGDPKQAIYRFRGGDLNVYLRARNEVDRIDVLLDNFRSTSSLMSGLNSLMSNGLQKSNLTVPFLNSCGKDDPIQLKDGEYPLQLITLSLNKSTTGTTSSQLPSKTKLEEIIPDVVSNTVLDLLERYKGELQPDDFCILVNRHDQASAVRTSMSSVGLPTRLVSTGDVFQSDAAMLLQNFLDCIAKPGDTASLRLLACSAFFNWSFSQLEESETTGELDDLAQKFVYFSQNFSRLGLLGCLADHLEGKTIADLSMRGGLFGDLKQCAQLAQESIHAKGLDALSAAEWLRRERLEPRYPIPDNRQPHSDLAEKAVSLLTVHRSKGLEYRVVICPYMWQAPPLEKDFLLRDDEATSWQFVLNHMWGKGRVLADNNREASIKESERLAYVAMTRARSMLILMWAQAIGQDGNPLKNFLFGSNQTIDPSEKLSTEQMQKWLFSNKVQISISHAKKVDKRKRWIDQEENIGQLSIGPIPLKGLDQSWGRSSYTTWLSKKNKDGDYSSFDPSEIDERNDFKQENFDSEISPDDQLFKPSFVAEWSNKGPLFNFPRGAAAGNCLHRILEKLDFSLSLHHSSSAQLIKDELQRSGLEKALIPSVQDGLEKALSTPLGGPLGDLRFNQLDRNRRIHEMSFDLPIAHNGKVVTADDLAIAFKKDSSARFADSYAESLSSLRIASRGFFTGSVDLVFADDDDLGKARWWVVDWKSNWLGERDDLGNWYACGPVHYTNAAMEKQMISHHYPLQAHLYLVALHRFLRWRLPNYHPSRHLGGYVYVFLRGMPGDVMKNGYSDKEGVPGLLLEEASIVRVLELDRLINEGGR